ncbi:MAG: TusE/DsrC/DsvC family sulfur relay protein [Hyphomicrobiaceae bacterium]|nr:TusE/DsrC/DsvC family sulfur relay protein [Caldilineaceae bacterium]MCB1513414.1 TusE/DsrC/DsvC family sulfur relay protein [Hyphomicrobiaceae bacterium]MCC0007173.1 TusE/DsrC/DsvC family sulfur relay protein [Hyphomicrobiaceae bacterium]
MAIEIDGREIETNDKGYLENLEDWSAGVAQVLASQDGVTLGEPQMAVINYLRDQYFNNNQTQPNTRTIVKAMAEEWGRNVDQKELYDLFNGDPSKIAGRIAGLPESRRKGGY